MKKYIFPVFLAIFGLWVAFSSFAIDSLHDYLISSIVLGMLLFVTSIIYGMKLAIDDMVETSFIHDEEK
jgi:hypothetical protein